MRKLLLTASAIAALACSPARAGLIAEYSTDGGSTFNAICSDVSGGACSSSFVAGGLTFTAFGATSNSPGDPSEADLLSAVVRMRNTTGSAHSIILRIGDTDFTAPVGHVSFLNSIAGTVVTGSIANLLSSTACVDPTNGQNSCIGAYTTPSIAAAITLPGSGNNSSLTDIPGLVGPYSMTELLAITLGAGGNINFSASSTVSPVPEPFSLGLLGAGLVGLGMVRRRAA